MKHYSIDTTIDDPSWQGIWEEQSKKVLCAIDAVLVFHKISYAVMEISLTLTSDTHMAELCAQYRGKNQPTNVLAFPVEDIETENIEQIANDYVGADQPWMLGDIVLSYGTIKAESQQQDKSFSDHVVHLIVHAMLHLLGYDHMEAKEAEEMEGLEIQILDKLGIQNPYHESSQ